VPFQGESFMGILTQHITAEPKPPSRMAAEHGRSLPPGIEDIILHAMRKDPEQRYQSMDELVGALVGAYRNIAGAGMSTFLHAYPSSGAHAAPNSPVPVRAAATPLPYGHGGVPPSGVVPMPPPSGDSSSPYHMPAGQSGYHGAPPLSPLPQVASDSYLADHGAGKKGGKVGLIIALIVILLGAAGAAGYFLFFNKKEGEQTAAAGTGTDPSGETPEGDPSSGKGVTPPPPALADAGAKVETPPPPAIDAGAKVVVKPPVVKKPKPWIQVLVNSKPQGADIVAADGKTIGTTPAIIKVQQGNPIKLTLKRKRFKEEAVSIDGSKAKVSYTLERMGRPDRPDRPDRPGPGEGGSPDPGPKGPCAVDPNSVDCRCSKDSSLPECGLE